MKKDIRKQLTLSRETLLTLEGSVLQGAVGRCWSGHSDCPWSGCVNPACPDIQ